MPLTSAQGGVAVPNTAVMGGSAVDPNSILGELGGVANLGANIYGLYNASQLQGSAQNVLNQSNPFGSSRPQYAQQLNTLMADPSSVAQLPGYQFLMDQGTQALERSAAGPGGTGLGSGAMGASLVQYGQGLADQFYQQQVSTLSNLAGAQFSPANPAQALQGVGGAAGSLGSSISGLANSLGGGVSSTAALLGKLFGGTATTPSAYNPTGSPFTGQPGQTSVDWSGDTSGGGLASGNPTWNLPGATTGGVFTGDPGQTSVDWSGDQSTPTFDLGGIFSNPNGAGGQAASVAPAAGMSLGSELGLAGSGLGIISGVTSGKPTSEASAGLQTTNLLASKTGTFGTNSSAVGSGAIAGLDALNIYSGISQGGVAGYATAANAAYGLATGTTGIPGVGAALSIYNAAENWQSGATGKDALGAAEAGGSVGATVGSIVPGIGTAIGAAAGFVIGGAVGAISSLAGSGKIDPENADFAGYTEAYNKASAAQKPQLASSVSNPYTALAGYFDLRSDQVGTSNTVYSKYGRMGEQTFTNDLISEVQTAQKGGVTDPTQMWNQVVQPWLTQQGKWSDGTTANDAAMNALVQNMTGQIMSGSYTTNFKSVGGQEVWNG